MSLEIHTPVSRCTHMHTAWGLKPMAACDRLRSKVASLFLVTLALATDRCRTAANQPNGIRRCNGISDTDRTEPPVVPQGAHRLGTWNCASLTRGRTGFTVPCLCVLSSVCSIACGKSIDCRLWWCTLCPLPHRLLQAQPCQPNGQTVRKRCPTGSLPFTPVGVNPRGVVLRGSLSSSCSS